MAYVKRTNTTEITKAANILTDVSNNLNVRNYTSCEQSSNNS